MRKRSNERCRGKKGEQNWREIQKLTLVFFLLLQPPKTDTGAPCPKNNWKNSCFAVYLQYHPIACDLISCSLFSFQSLYSRVPACQITTYYYVGFAYLMMKRYQVSMKKWKQTAYSYSVIFENELHLVGLYTCRTLLFLYPTSHYISFLRSIKILWFKQYQ